MTKSLIDKNEAFSQYFALGTGRSLKKLHENMCRDSPESVPGYTTLKDWSLKYSWQNQVMLMDKAVADGLKDRLVPSWVELKAELIGPKVEKLSPAATVLGSALSFQSWHIGPKVEKLSPSVTLFEYSYCTQINS